jgi:hypothetical protein
MAVAGEHLVPGLVEIQGVRLEETKMRNDDLNRTDDLDRRTGMSGGLMALIAAVAVLAVLFMWAPWSGPRIADNTAPGTTVGSSTRPVTPPAPVSREPAIPAAPSTTR